MIVVLLAACSGPNPKTSDPFGEGTGPAPTPDTGTPTDSETTFGPPPLLCVTEQDVTSGVLVAGWRSPGGTLYATRVGPSSAVRSPDGVWTLDAVQPGIYWQGQIDGVDDDEVWALSSDGARRREADGSWTDMGAPGGSYDLEGLRVFAADDVVVLRVDDRNCADCATRETPVLLWWDGSGWTEDVKAEIQGSVAGMTVLPDRTVVLAADGGLRVIDPVAAPISTPPGLRVGYVASAPDGTLVAVGSGGVAIGTVAGLTLTDPGLDVYAWTHAWASSATDVWVSGEQYHSDGFHGVIAHWDGLAWTPVVEDWPGETFRLAGGDGEVFAVGGYTHELVLVGDEDGLAIDREAWNPNYINELAVDDVTGEAWSVGYGSVAGVFRSGRWTGVPLPAEGGDADKIAASDGRVALTRSGEWLHVYEDGELTSTPTPDSFFFWLAGADGVLFAAGRPATVDEEPTGGIGLLQEAGAGWVPIDVAGLPADAEVSALWADGATDLWVGLEVGRAGAIAHWDGTGWTTVAQGLDSGPDWMRRLSDGRLYFTQFSGDAGTGRDSLWVYDGAATGPVPDMPPDVRAAHLLPDGTWFTSVIALAPTADEDLFGALMQKDPGGDWVELYRTDYSVAMVGDGWSVWAEQDELSWTRAPCEP